MLTKEELQEGAAVILGLCGFVSVSIGAIFFTTGLAGVATIKLGEMLKTHQHQLHKAAIDGSIAIGGGMVMSGLGLAIAHSYQKKRLTVDAQIKLLLKVEKSAEPVDCSSCRYYNPNNQYLACAVQPQSVNTELAANCSDWTAKEATNQK